MKMTMQIFRLVVLIATTRAATLKHVHHREPVDIPGDGSSDIDNAGDAEPPDPEMPAGAVDVAVQEAPRPVKLRQQRHPIAKTKQVPVVRESSSSLRRNLKQEHSLRLSADRLVKKLTAALNHTTDALMRKDREVAKASMKLHNAKSSEKAAASEHMKLLAAENQQVASSEHVKRLAAEKNAALAKQAAASEHIKRLAAEKTVAISHVAISKMAVRLQSMSKTSSMASAMNALKLKKQVEKLKADNKRLTDDNAKAQKDVARMTDHVDEAEAARKTKTEDLAGKLNEIERLQKKGKDDLASLQQQDDKKMAALKQQLKDEEAKKEAVFKKQNMETQASIVALKKLVTDLNATGSQLMKKVSKEEQQVKHEQSLVKKAAEKTAAEHKAFLKASKEIATQKAQLNKDQTVMKQLKAQAVEMKKVQHQITELFAKNSKLEQSNVKRKADLNSALKKLKAEGKTLKVERKLLGQSTAKLKQASKAKVQADSRVHTLWKALKQKKATLQIHDEELKNAQQELSATSEEKSVLAKELSVTQSKLAMVAREKKKLAAARAEVVNVGKKINAKNKELAAMRKQLKTAAERTEDFNTVKAKQREAVLEQKALVDQLAAAKQQEKDKLAAAAAKMEELKVQLLAADEKEKELKAKNIEASKVIKKKDEDVRDAWAEEAKIKANRLADALNAEIGVNDVSDDDFMLNGAAMKLEASLKRTNITKAALLTGKSVLRSRNLQRALATKDKQLKLALSQLQSTQAEVNAKDLELEQARQAILHAAAMQLPSATAKEAAAARTALENVDGKLDARERELNATKIELLSQKGEHHIEQQELQVLRDDHTMLGSKVKKLSAELAKEHKETKKVNEEVFRLRASARKAEKAHQDLLLHSTELEKVAKAAQAKIDQENATKAAAAQQAAAQQAVAQKAAAEQQRQAAAEEQRRAATERQAQSRASKSSSEDSDDDDDDEAGDDGKDDAFAATVPWDNIRKKMSNNVKPGGKAVGFL